MILLGIVVQNDLIDALKNGTIFAAGLDVMVPEPLPANDELTKLPNCGKSKILMLIFNTTECFFFRLNSTILVIIIQLLYHIWDRQHSKHVMIWLFCQLKMSSMASKENH